MAAAGATLLALIATGCGRIQAPAATTVPSPSASPTASASLVAGDHQIVVLSGVPTVPGGQSPYTVKLVGLSGVVASATGREVAPEIRHGAGLLNPVSASNSRVYFRDGDSNIDFLTISGDTGLAMSLDAETPDRAISFAVSPDDKRIAVSVFDYNASGIMMHAYVEDMGSGANRVDLFSSRSRYEAPVGWHNGSIVFAAQPQHVQNIGGISVGAYGGYHIVDPSNGATVATVAAKLDCTGGLPTPAGVECVDPRGDAHRTVWNWSGHLVATIGARQGCLDSGPLSPDGTRIASFVAPAPNGGCGPGPIAVIQLSTGAATPHRVRHGDTPTAWLDDSHLLLRDAMDPDVISGVEDINSDSGTAISVHGDIAAALPGGL